MTELVPVFVVVGAYTAAVMAGAILGAVLAWLVWALRPFNKS